METLERFDARRRVIEDFTSRTLAALPAEFLRLSYVASLCDSGAGRYRHDGLSALYPDAAVQEALAYCHEELFSRVLEMSLEQQEWDLRASLADTGDDFWETLARWRKGETYRGLIPDAQPAYLADLFLSNVRTLLDVLTEERATWESAA